MTNSKLEKGENRRYQIRKKFEYKQIKGNDVNLLNKEGEEGWEIVAIDRGWVLLKREM